MEPTYTPHDETGLDPLNRLYEYLSGQVKTIVPKNEQEITARREAIGRGFGKAYDAVVNPLNAAGRLMSLPFTTGARILGINAPSPYDTPTPQIPNEASPYSAANPADFMGAIPPSKRVRPAGPRIKPGVPQVVTPPAGVLPVDEAMGAGGMYSGQAGVDSMMAANPAASSTPAAPQRVAEPVKTLRDEYIARMAGLNKPMDDKLTEQQKGMAILEASLAGLAAASKPGASMMGSIGQGGLVGTAAARDMQRVNREQAERRRAEDRATAAGEFAIAQGDIERGERAKRHEEDIGLRRDDLQLRRDSEARQKARDEAADARENRRLDLAQQQFEASGWHVVDGGDGFKHAYNTRTQQDIKTGIKIKPERNQTVETIQFLMDHPEGRKIWNKEEAIDLKDENKLKQLWLQGRVKAMTDTTADLSKYPTWDEFKSMVSGGQGGQRTAPPAAIEMLRKNPQLKDDFMRKYGYLPAGF